MLKAVKRIVAIGVVLVGVATPPVVMAHTPYIVPATFEPLRGGIVTLDAAFAEKFFVPEIAISDAEFYVVNPDGKKSKVDSLYALASRVVLEHKLEQDGTYRFSTGLRTGRIFRVYEQDGKRKSLMNTKDKLPAGAILVEHFQTLTRSDTFVSKGAPNKKALDAERKGLELVPITHPNELFVGDEFAFAALFNGKPLNKAEVDVYLAKYQFDMGKAQFTVRADSSKKDGKLSFIPKQPGVYLLRVRHRTDAPQGSSVPVYSYTYSMVVEVVQ
ncbi:MAG: DUF4198 domain-containing protein [Spongiibacteraceae bacterium]